MSDIIEPFTIAIDQAELDDLANRIAATRWPDAQTCQNWDQGIPLSYTQELAEYWRTDYDWRVFERRLNAWPHFKTAIDGIDIHFTHVRSPEPDALPLIMSHGWPGSVAEFHKVIDALTETAHCIGIHTTMPIVAPDPDTMDALDPVEQAALEAASRYRAWESGYSKQQSTRPQTLAYGLADSPVGQMAWIVEKFYAWTDCEKDGVKHPEHVISRGELLDNVMLYWLNNCAASSARLYWESFNKPDLTPIDMPVGCSLFPAELLRCSRRWAEKRFSRLIYWNELPRGGHFAALEQPEVLIEEIRNCFDLLR